MDDIERAAIAAEGYDPDDPAVVAALARVSATLADLGRQSGGILVDHERGAYADRLRVIYHCVPERDAEPTATVVLVVDGSTVLNRDELRHQIEALQPDPYIYDERYRSTSWGGSGALLDITVQIGYGILSAGVWEGLKAIASQIRSAAAPPGPAGDPVDGLLAIRQAKEITVAAFVDVHRDDLTVSSVHVVGTTATVVLTGSDGSVYTVQPEMFDGGAIGPITRTHPPTQH